LWVALWVEVIMSVLKSARSVETITQVGYHRCDALLSSALLKQE